MLALRCLKQAKSELLRPAVRYCFPKISSTWISEKMSFFFFDRKYASCGTGKDASIKVVYKPYLPKYDWNHDRKNMKLGRPMSPHLAIYSMNVTANISVYQRGTGMYLSALFALLAATALFATRSVDCIIDFMQSFQFSPTQAYVIKFLLALPFFLHYFNALRYISYYFLRLLTVPAARSSAFLAMIVAVVAAALMATITRENNLKDTFDYIRSIELPKH